jgi:hypothetical protein
MRPIGIYSAVSKAFPKKVFVMGLAIEKEDGCSDLKIRNFENQLFSFCEYIPGLFRCILTCIFSYLYHNMSIEWNYNFFRIPLDS